MRKNDNRGLTFVELIIAISISVIVLVAATLFIKNAINSYNVASDTIDLQMESQILMEQLGKWIMEGNRVKTDGDVLLIYEIPRSINLSKLPTPGPAGTPLPTPDTSSPNVRAIWSNNGKMYMKEQYLPDVNHDTVTINPSTDETEDKCIGAYVEQFLPEVKDTGKDVVVDLALKLGKRSYNVKNQFKLRNELNPVPTSTP